MSIKDDKNRIRQYIWSIMEEKNIARFPRPVYGRIPNFVGAREAAINLSRTSTWRKARIVKVNPDSPQKWVRLIALREGKILLMASPRMREGFILIDPREIPSYLYEKAATIKGAFQLGRRVSIDEIAKLGGIDLIVTGSVAVDVAGHRIGKGEGYAELEYTILRELGLVTNETPIATTVHDIQVIKHVPREPYDLVVDYIVTPTRVIKVTRREDNPPGILWDILSCEKMREIPLLKDLARRKGVRKQC